MNTWIRRFLAVGLSSAVLLLSGCGDSPEVEMVKNGSLRSCPNMTVEEMVNGFMGSPSWESGVAEDGSRFVNIDGDITLHDKPVRAALQFLVDLEAGTFDFNAFETNEVPQPTYMALGLLDKMCEA